MNTAPNGGACDGLHNLRNPLPWDGDGAEPGAFPSVFGRSTDEEAVVFLYDRHVSLYKNTVEHPASVA